MAKDRQRSSKGRRRRPAGGNAGNPARSRARDMGLDDPTIDEAGIGETTPAPDPLKNASADADQAFAAESGASRGGPGEEIDAGEPDAVGEETDLAPYEDDFERAPDELQEPVGATVSGRGPIDPAVASERRERADRKQRGRVLSFLRASWEELHRVQWPDRKHVAQATAVVLGFVLIAGGWLGLMDAIWKPVVNAIL